MYDVLSAFFCKYKKTIVVLCIGVACVFAAFYAGYLCGIRNASIESEIGNYISNNRTGSDTVRNEIGDAGSAISAARSGIDSAAAALIELKQELMTLRKELTTSKEKLLMAENSLQNANRSLQQYAQEEKKKRLKIKAQRNTWVGASILLAAIAIVK